SAGRVRSPALRLIVERELEIERFVAREYWGIEADCSAETKGFSGRLTYFGGEKLEQFSIGAHGRADEVEAALWAAAQGKLRVATIEKKQRRRNPSPPFTTSTLQQESARKLGYSASRTMRLAQQLYEGIDIGGEVTRLGRYMRFALVDSPG